VTVGDWLTDAAAQLTAAGTSSQRLDAELILGHVLGHDRAWIKAHDDDDLAPGDHDDANQLLARRANHEPLVHLTGHREFYGLDLSITPDVLTPRVETEQMVEWAIKYAPRDGSLIDIGTGSGALAIAIKLHRPDLVVTATEVSPAALEIARANARALKTDIAFVQSDLWNSVEQTFDVVVTNLPYLRDDAELMPEVQREPAVALFGGSDGLELYRRFLHDLPKHLKPGGYLFTECDPWQHEDLIAEASRAGLSVIEQGYFILGFERR
jgi:release factor glutamine methyltransferase